MATIMDSRATLFVVHEALERGELLLHVMHREFQAFNSTSRHFKREAFAEKQLFSVHGLRRTPGSICGTT
jgi:hypothetical protein